MLSPACFYTSVRTGAALSSPADQQKKDMQKHVFLFWWARRDLNLSHVTCLVEHIDRKPGLPCPQNRPLIDLAAQNAIRNNNPAPSPVLPVMVTDRTRNRTVFELTCVVDQLADLLSGFFGGGRQNVAVNVHSGSNVFVT